MRIFEKLGIMGWQSIEPSIIASVAADMAVLFVGPHGTNKTEGAKIISEALIGDDINFCKYDVPLLQMEDLLGFPNPNAMKEGKIEYLQTPLSIWKQDAVLLDEFNRTNLFTQSKLMEIVRNKTVMGEKTKLKIVFSAVNPPEDYNSGFMDLAVASRFVTFQVNNNDLTNEQVIDIIRHGNKTRDASGCTELRGIIQKINEWNFTDEQDESIAVFVNKIQNVLARLKVKYEMRQAVGLQKIMRNLIALNNIGAYDVNSTDISKAVIATIPQMHGIVTDEIARNEVENTISGECNKFAKTLGTYNVDDCLSYSKKNAKDNLLWTSELIVLLEKEESSSKLDKVQKVIDEKLKDGKITFDNHQNISNVIHKKKSLSVFAANKDEVASMELLNKLAGKQVQQFIRDDSKKHDKGSTLDEEQKGMNKILEGIRKSVNKNEDMFPG